MRKISLLDASVAICGAALALAPALTDQAAPQAVRARIAIAEIWYNSPGRDTGSNASLNHEWVELHNNTGRAISLTRWTLRDAAGHVYKFGAFTLRAHAYVTIPPGDGAHPPATLYRRPL